MPFNPNINPAASAAALEALKRSQMQSIPQTSDFQDPRTESGMMALASRDPRTTAPGAAEYWQSELADRKRQEDAIKAHDLAKLFGVEDAQTQAQLQGFTGGGVVSDTPGSYRSPSPMDQVGPTQVRSVASPDYTPSQRAGIYSRDQAAKAAEAQQELQRGQAAEAQATAAQRGALATAEPAIAQAALTRSQAEMEKARGFVPAGEAQILSKQMNDIINQLNSPGMYPSQHLQGLVDMFSRGPGLMQRRQNLINQLNDIRQKLRLPIYKEEMDPTSGLPKQVSMPSPQELSAATTPPAPGQRDYRSEAIQIIKDAGRPLSEEGIQFVINQLQRQ